MLKTATPFLSNRIRYIDIEKILANPNQPRKRFDDEALSSLANSIRRHGIIQPLTVRNLGGVWELVAGERRLRAARLAGLEQVPCIVLGANAEKSSMLALIENIQRRDLDFVEEAEGISRLLQTFGLTQEQVARELGRSQSAVANKLRILGHPRDLLELLRSSGCTERHARALLRIDTEQRMKVAETVVERGLNVAQTEELVERLLQEQKPVRHKGRRLYVMKDVRIFLNTVRGAVDQIKRAGVAADIGEEEHDDGIVLTIRIPKSVAASGVRAE